MHEPLAVEKAQKKPARKKRSPPKAEVKFPDAPVPEADEFT